MLDFNHPEIAFALKAVGQACQLVRHIQTELASAALAKEDRSPVTVADFAAQALVGYLVSRAFPYDPLVGEEDSHTLQSSAARPILEQVTRYLESFIPQVSSQAACAWIDRGCGEASGRYWVIDPIDGTKGFLRGGQYAVALALIETGQVRLGVLGCPNLDLPGVPGFQPPGALFLAVSSEGTWQTGMPVGRTADFYAGQFSRLEVSSQSDPAQARLLRSFEASHTNVQKLDQLLHQLNVKPEPLRLDSQVKYALLAAGKADAMVRPQPASDPSYHEKVWDHAAGSLVVEEAGGQVTDLDGMKLDLTTGRFLARNRGILVTNEHLHPAFLSAVKATGL